MTARILSSTEARIPAFAIMAREGVRYFMASAAALAVDAGVYVILIRIADVHYLIAAPIGFALGIALVYVLSTSWVFTERRLSDSRAEFMIFSLIGLAGLVLTEVIIYASVSELSHSYERAKLLSAGTVFGFNFIARKLVLFTRYTIPK